MPARRAAGKTRFVLYNRSGNELRVESRTQNLYTKQLENSIFLCAMSGQRHAGCGHGGPDQHGKAAGIQPLHGAAAQLDMTSNDGTPPADGLFPDSRKLAAAAITVSQGLASILIT